jgi:hypothetical protein
MLKAPQNEKKVNLTEIAEKIGEIKLGKRRIDSENDLVQLCREVFDAGYAYCEK